jgi:hypothetical protein
MIVKSVHESAHTCVMVDNSGGLHILNTFEDLRVGCIVDPQSALDTIHQLFPELEFSPLPLKEGEWVNNNNGMVGMILHVMPQSGWLVVELEDKEVAALNSGPYRIWQASHCTRVES